MASLASAALAGTIQGEVATILATDQKNAVIYIDSVPGLHYEPPAEPALIDQRGLQFIPRVLPVLEGTTVSFRNSDSILHNVFTPGQGGESYDLGTWPLGETRAMVFDRSRSGPRVAVMLCKVHPEMAAYVIVLGNPFFAVSDSLGLFQLTDIPAGTYTLRTWHEFLPPTLRPVTIGRDDTLNLLLELGE